MTTSSAGMNNRMPMKVEETSTNNTSPYPASPIVGDTKTRKTSRLQKIRASYSINKTDQNESPVAVSGKSPLKHLRKKLHKTRRRASTGNKEDPASPSSSTNNTTASHSSALLEANGNSKNNNTNHSSSRFGRVKRSSSTVGSKLRQSLRGSVVKGTAMVMKKEPSLVPDVDKKINKSIASKISASLKHRRSSHGDNGSSKKKDKPPARERSVSRERTSKMDPSSTGFSSDSYQPASAPTAKKKKKPGKTKKKSNAAALDSTEKQAMALELMLNPSVSYHAASPFHTNSDTEEVPLAGGGAAHPKKKLKKKKKKKMHRRSQSATLAEPSLRSKDDDFTSEDEDDNGPNNGNTTNNHTLQPHQPLSQRQQLMRHSQTEWSSEPDFLNQKMTGLEARLANLQKLLTNTSDDTEDEDEEIYDSEEITVASGSGDIPAAPPPMSPTSPSQLKRLTSKGALFHKNGLDSSSSSSESESDAEDSATADSFAAGGSSQDGDDFMNSCDFQFFQDDDDKDEDGTDDEQDGAGDLLNSGELELVLGPKKEEPPSTTRMDSSDKRFPNAPVTRGRATEPRSAAPKPSMTTHSTVDPLAPPIASPPFPKKRAPPSRVASIDSTGDIGNSDHIVEDEEVTMRRSNSRDRPSSRATPIHEEEVTLRRSNSYDRLARTSGFATLNENEEEEEMVPLNESWRTSSNNHKTWQSESSLPYLQQQANIAFQSESSVPPPKKHNVHPLVSPGRGKRKAFKNPLNAGGDLLQTPLMRNSSAPSSITTSTTTTVNSSSARKPSVAATSHHSPVGRKSLVSATNTSSPHGSPPFLRTVVAGANSKTSRRRQRSKSRDRTRVEKSLGRVGLSHETVEDVDEQELLNYLTSGRAERKSLPMGGDQKLPPYATPGRGERKALSSASLAKRNRRSGLKRSNSSSDNTSSANRQQNQNVSVTKTPRTSSTISAESPSSPLLEMQGSLEQLKKVTPPFPTKGGADDEDILSDDDDDNVNDDTGDHSLTLGAVGRRTAHQLRRRQSSSSQLLSDIQQESQEKRHQHHLENRDSLLNVLSAAGDP